MKRVFCSTLLLAGLLLSACAPAASSPPMTDSDSGRLSLQHSAGLSLLTFSSGDLTAYDLRLTITGRDLRVNAPAWCKVDASAIKCTVPELPAGRNFLLPMTGSDLNVVALYKRVPAGDDLTRKAP